MASRRSTINEIKDPNFGIISFLLGDQGRDEDKEAISKAIGEVNKKLEETQNRLAKEKDKT